MGVFVVGVRHHSPACARIVRSTIDRVRPRFVLIEGPSDMNERIDELGLGHTLPIAVYSYRNEAGSSSGSWSPLCDYSPEWIALVEARATGATALFMDLPAWDPAFREIHNRYSDRHARRSDPLALLADRLGLEGTDTLWDRLFEQPGDLTELAARMLVYFEELRRGDEVSERDRRREAYMARWIAWAAAQGDVVAVCGGYHAPELERAWQSADGSKRPEVPMPEGDAKVGSYLVPYSFKRLDSFAGYESGMPSPGFYQTVWEQGPDAGPEAMLFLAVSRLRAKAQRVSAADAIAASTLAHGLKALRGHTALARVDVLDGLAGALLKDALDAPLPWTRRGTILPRTDPMLVELVAAFAGERVGALAEGTPRPPLVADAEAELHARGLEPGDESRRVRVVLTEPDGIDKSRVLHRLRILGVPGFTLERGPSFGRRDADLSEQWALRRLLEADAALIEAAIHGATLAAAATGKLQADLRQARGLAEIAALLHEAALAGAGELAETLLAEVSRAVGAEPSLDALGAAVTRLLGLFRHDTLLGVQGSATLASVLEAAFDRGLWLVEGIRGATPADPGQIQAVLALRDTLRHAGPRLVLDAGRAHAVCARRAADRDAPPALRGATLGFAWSTGAFTDPAAGEADALRALAAAARPSEIGDFLVGLFALGREEVRASDALLAAIDRMLVDLDRSDFLIALPALRMAFAYFPPRERLGLAESVLALHGLGRAHAPALLERVDADAFRRGAALDAEVASLAARYGLSDDQEDA